MRNQWWIALAAAGAFALAASAQDKDSFTPMALDSGFGHLDISAPTTPPEEIIKKFAAKESEFQEALNHYTYRRVAKVQTIDDDNKVDGEYYEIDDVIFDHTGQTDRESGVRARKYAATGQHVPFGSSGHSARIPVRTYLRNDRCL